jgi:tetratricopeptide (TPR) repeat protein
LLKQGDSVLFDCSQDPGDAGLTEKYLAGLVFWQVGRYEEAADCWEGSEILVDRVLARGIHAYDEADPETAFWLATAAQIAQEDEQQRKAHYYLGKTYARSGDSAAAMNEYWTAIDYPVARSSDVPSDSDIYFAMAIVQDGLGNRDEAKQNLMLATDHGPDNAAAWHELGEFLFKREGDLDAAVHALRRADLIEPGNPLHLVRAAGMLAKHGSLSEAMSLYEELLDRGLQDHWLYAGLANVYTLQGDYGSAQRIALECAEELSPPGFGDCWKQAGIASLYLGDYPAAVSSLEEAAARGSQMQVMCELLSAAYDSLNDSELGRRLQVLDAQHCGEQ